MCPVPGALALLLFPFLASAQFLAPRKLNNDIVNELTEESFDALIASSSKVMVDFVRGGDQTTELKLAMLKLKEEGSKAPIARVDIDKYPALTKRFFSGCDERHQKCQNQFPQLLWFVNGKPTHYHRNLDDAQQIFNFVSAMDRDLVLTLSSFDDTETLPWDRYVLFTGQRSSAMYSALEHVASAHMDTVAVAHLEEPGSNSVSWIRNKTTVDTFAGDTPDDNSVEAWLRTHLTFGNDAPEQPVQEDGSVLVVASTFEEQVLRNDTDAFLLVYAPWCGFSRKVIPQWSEFARTVTADMSGLVVAKMDGSANVIETKEYKWKTFPTMVYFRAGDKTPLEYEGERTVEGFVKFAKRVGSKAAANDDSVVMLQISSDSRKGMNADDL